MFQLLFSSTPRMSSHIMQSISNGTDLDFQHYLLGSFPSDENHSSVRGQGPFGREIQFRNRLGYVMLCFLVSGVESLPSSAAAYKNHILFVLVKHI